VRGAPGSLQGRAACFPEKLMGLIIQRDLSSLDERNIIVVPSTQQLTHTHCGNANEGITCTQSVYSKAPDIPLEVKCTCPVISSILKVVLAPKYSCFYTLNGELRFPYESNCLIQWKVSPSFSCHVRGNLLVNDFDDSIISRVRLNRSVHDLRVVSQWDL
jgi:hypothetical protein